MYLKIAGIGKNDWWMYILGIFLILLSYFVGQMVLYGAVILNEGDYNKGVSVLQDFESSMQFSDLNMSKNLILFLLIFMFVFALATLYIVVKYLHKRQFISLITAQNKIRYPRIFFSFFLWFSLTFIFEFINLKNDPSNYNFSFDLGSYFVLILISFLFLPVQTSFEELFFRGYIMQGLAYISKNKWIVLLVSSILFGLVHGTNPEVEKFGFWTMQIYYVMAGLFLGIITVLDDGLELALGVHAATNIFGAAMFSYGGSVIQTDSLYTSENVNPYLMIYAFLIASVAFFLICSKKYQWDFRNLLNVGID